MKLRRSLGWAVLMNDDLMGESPAVSCAGRRSQSGPGKQRGGLSVTTETASGRVRRSGMPGDPSNHLCAFPMPEKQGGAHADWILCYGGAAWPANPIFERSKL